MINLVLECKLSVEKKAYETFNISSNKLLSFYDIAQQIAEIFFNKLNSFRKDLKKS